MLRILIVDDTNLIRQALNICFQAESDLKIVGTARNGKEAIAKIVKFNPDIVVMDMDMPEMDGLTATTIISEYISRTKVVIFSSYSHQNYIERALRVGASGYLLKSQPVDELPEAIRLIHHHDSPFARPF
ncbi:MAG: response regulator transcription factor [Xenococcaceae cyanobacterium MO_188.B32]|nr:response regulator transcription factor [Xenococcaceae cyanobacterium MO_188.B32]